MLMARSSAPSPILFLFLRSRLPGSRRSVKCWLSPNWPRRPNLPPSHLSPFRLAFRWPTSWPWPKTWWRPGPPCFPRARRCHRSVFRLSSVASPGQSWGRPGPFSPAGGYTLGRVDCAMATANVLVVVPSLENSFKLATAGGRLGRFSQDRTGGMLGELGQMPRVVPVEIRLNEAGGKARDFKVELANDKILTPLLVNMTVASLLASEERSIGDLSYALEGDVYLDNGASVHLEDLFSGNLDAAVTSLSGLLTAVVYYLSNNEFQAVGIHRIKLNIGAREEARFSSLERVWLDKYEVSAGEVVPRKNYCRAFGGQSLQGDDSLQAPPLPAGSEFHLLIADAAPIHEIPVRIPSGGVLGSDRTDPVDSPGVPASHSLCLSGDGVDTRPDEEIGDSG